MIHIDKSNSLTRWTSSRFRTDVLERLRRPSLQVDAQDPSCAQAPARICHRRGSSLWNSRRRLRARSASASYVGGRSIIGSGHFPRLIRRFTSSPQLC